MKVMVWFCFDRLARKKLLELYLLDVEFVNSTFRRSLVSLEAVLWSVVEGTVSGRALVDE